MTFIWPDNRQFALFLSHDIDTIYERNFWTLAGCLRRLELTNFIGKILSSKDPLAGVEEILHIEDYYNFHSTFFLLEDRTFSHFGGRYVYNDANIHKLAAMVKSAHDELALQGAYFAFNDSYKYERQNESFAKNFGQKALGIRNHYLLHSGNDTWQTQARAGLKYDSTTRKGFWPFTPLAEFKDFVVLPMTVMDIDIIDKTKGCSAKERLQYAKDKIVPVIEAGGLVTLNFHNNYFADSYYSEFQELYENLLAWLAEQKPWNGTGLEIAYYYLAHQKD